MGDGHSLQLSVAKTMIVSGVVRASRPDRGLRQLNSLAKWGFTLAGGLGAAAARSPGKIASVDPYGTSTFADMAERTTAMASGIAASGFTKDCKFAVLARNHSAMVECMVAASKLGADLVLLNTGLAARSIEEIIKQHTVDALFVDDDFEPQVRYLPAEIRLISTHPNSVVPQRRSIEHLISAGARTKAVAPPKQPGKLMVLTSGTTGYAHGCTPTHATWLRRNRRDVVPDAAARDEVMLLSAPLFHT